MGEAGLQGLAIAVDVGKQRGAHGTASCPAEAQKNKPAWSAPARSAQGGEKGRRGEECSAGQERRQAGVAAAIDPQRGHGELEQVQGRQLRVGGARRAEHHPFERQAARRPDFEAAFDAAVDLLENGPQLVVLAAFVAHEPVLSCGDCLI